MTSSPLVIASLSLPSQSCSFNPGPAARYQLLRAPDHIFRIPGAVVLAKSVAASDEGHRVLVIHRRTGEDLTDIPRRSNRVRVAVRSFRVDVNQSHLHRRERILEIPAAGVALITQPLSSEFQ